MHGLWSNRTSVTRDFITLSAVIVFIALLASIWVAYDTFTSESHKIEKQLQEEASRIDQAFTREVGRASFLLEAIGRQIIQRNTQDKTIIAQMLRAYDTNNTHYTTFLWVDEELQAVTSSSQGILDNPIDVSDRDYIQQSQAEPFRVKIGKPVRGRVSERPIIPLGMGLTDYTGKYIGTVTLSLDIPTLRSVVDEHLQADGLAYALLDPDQHALARNSHAQSTLQSAEIQRGLNSVDAAQEREGVLYAPSLFSDNRTFAYYRFASQYDYLIVVGQENQWTTLRRLMIPRLVQLGFIAAFLVSLLWLVRFRVIVPVQELSNACTQIARGKADTPIPQGGPAEIANLSRQLQNLVDYIAERKRIEQELVGKVLSLKTAKDVTEVSDLAKMELLSMMRQEVWPAMDKILAAASVLQEQPYGPIKGDDYDHYIDSLDRGSSHLAEILRELFEFPRLNRSDSLLNRRPVDVRGLMHKCVMLLRHTLKSEEVTVTIRMDDDLPKLPINELHLMHVVEHLLLACVHSIPAGGELTISAALEEHNQHTEFAIFFKDNGTGLDTQHIARLWRTNEPETVRTYHHEEAHERVSLAITPTKNIIIIHNGHLTMQNPPGKEAIIAVYFQQS